jgi:hypothetical protein
MLLPREQAFRFINGYKAVLLRVLANTNTKSTVSTDQDLCDARAKVHEDRKLLDAALSDLAREGSPVEPDVVAAIRSVKLGLWLYLKQNNTHAVFLDKAVSKAYAVKALTTPLTELLDGAPVAIETGLFEYEGVFVCDGLVLRPVGIGPGLRAQLREDFSRLRKSGHFLTRPAAA